MSIIRAVPPAAEPAMMAVRLLEEEGDDGGGIVVGNVVEVCQKETWARMVHDERETYDYCRSIDKGGECGRDGRWCSILRRRRCRRRCGG